MPHVDDGLLHAYLDGALEAIADAGELPDGMTAADVTAHLATCADCRSRLDAERDVRERAGIVLGQAVPATIGAPTFSDLSNQGRARRRSWMPMTWAASVVLALGAGWWGSMVWRTDTQQMAAMERSADAAVPSAASADAFDSGDTPPAAPQADVVESIEIRSPELDSDGGRSGSRVAAIPAERLDSVPGAGHPAAAAGLIARAPAPVVAPDAANVVREPLGRPAAQAFAGKAADLAVASTQRREAEPAAPMPATPPAPIDAAAARAATTAVTEQASVPVINALVAGTYPLGLPVIDAAGFYAFRQVLEREQRGEMLFDTAAIRDIDAGNVLPGQIFVIAGASAPAIEVAREIGQATARVRQTLQSGETVEIVSWKLAAVELNELVIAGVTAPEPVRSAPLPAASPARHVYMVTPLPDGRQELVTQDAGSSVWIAIRADATQRDIRLLSERLVPYPR